MTDDLSSISIEQLPDGYRASVENSGITGEGQSRTEALLQLISELSEQMETGVDPLDLALDVFVSDPGEPETLSMPTGDWTPENPDEDRVERNRALVRYLAKNHKRQDYSEPHHFSRLLGMAYGPSHLLQPETLGEHVAEGRWPVFEAIANGTRRIEEIAEGLGSSETAVEEAVAHFKGKMLVGESSDGRLFIIPNVVGVMPYPIEAESVFDWERHREHKLVTNLAPEEMPSTADEGVFVERMGNDYGWFHDPAEYRTSFGDTVMMSREEAVEAGSDPCPRCFPDTDFAEQYDVTGGPGGLTHYVHKSAIPDETDSLD
jgi:hypothetical protein